MENTEVSVVIKDHELDREVAISFKSAEDGDLIGNFDFSDDGLNKITEEDSIYSQITSFVMAGLMENLGLNE